MQEPYLQVNETVIYRDSESDDIYVAMKKRHIHKYANVYICTVYIHKDKTDYNQILATPKSYEAGRRLCLK